MDESVCKRPRVRPVGLQIGVFTVDDRRKRIYCDSELLSLTPKEFALLQRLLAEPETVYSAYDIAEFLWPGAPDELLLGKGHEIRQFIYSLRKKLAACGAEHARIRTIRGFGYQVLVG
jgi:DNA-binding response OmpR family regulator